jgi:GT2 family glycosyltransferase
MKIMKYEPQVAIIILNWNGWKDTIECLESVYQIIYQNYNVIVVDNGSDNESIEKIKEYLSGEIQVKSNFFGYSVKNKPIQYIEYSNEETDAIYGKKNNISEIPFNKKLILIKNQKNYGFAEGNNIAIRYVLKSLNTDYILLLNNDTVVDKEFLGGLVNVGEEDLKIGILGPAIYYYERKDEIQSTGVKIRWNRGSQKVLKYNNSVDEQFNQKIEVEYVAGCALLAKVELIRKIGYLNSEYYAYWEETDWCIRALKAGFKVICVPKIKIWHKGGKTTKKRSNGFFEYHSIRNMFWFMKQHATKKQFWSFQLYFFGLGLWYECGLQLVYRRNIKGFISLFKGVKDGILKEPNFN